MHFTFDERRATQAVAVLLRLAGGAKNYTWLLKVLYLADRESLKTTGAPIAGGSFCNMKNGPLASDVYRCVKHDGEHRIWNRFIATENYDLKLLSDPGDSELSDFDVEVLTNCFEQHKSKHYSTMIDIVHELPEWENPGSTSTTLRPEAILRGAGVSDDAISDFERLNRHVDQVDALLS